jgi:hypothetical protein
MDWTNGPGYNELLDQLGIGSGNVDTEAPTFDSFDASTSSIRSGWQTSLPASTSSASDHHRPGSDLPNIPLPERDLSENIFQSLLNDLTSIPSSDTSLDVEPTSYITSSARATPEIQRQAIEVWERLSLNAPQTIASRSLRPSTPTPPMDTVDLDAHTPHPNTLLPALGRLDIETNTFLPVVPLDSSQSRTASGARPGEAYGGHSGHPDTMVRYGRNGHGNQAAGQNGKRQRVFDSAGSSPSSTTLESLHPWERDPWHIWQAKDENGSRTVAWSRKEQVQESLADTALGIELSRHLITVYFQAVHFSLPASHCFFT